MPGVLPGVHCTKNVGECEALGSHRARGKVSTESRWRGQSSIIRCCLDRQVVGACGFGPVAASGNLPVVVRLVTRGVSLIPVE